MRDLPIYIHFDSMLRMMWERYKTLAGLSRELGVNANTLDNYIKKGSEPSYHNAARILNLAHRILNREQLEYCGVKYAQEGQEAV